jgi:hypothetical protein
MTPRNVLPGYLQGDGNIGYEVLRQANQSEPLHRRREADDREGFLRPTRRANDSGAHYHGVAATVKQGWVSKRLQTIKRAVLPQVRRVRSEAHKLQYIKSIDTLD